MHRMNDNAQRAAWRVAQAVAASVLLAIAIVMTQPYSNICLPCEQGLYSWWVCFLAGCW